MKGKFRFKNLIIIVLCIIFVFGFIKQQSAMNRIKKETKEKTEKLQQVKEENERLTDEINMSQTDEYHEKLAREKLNMIKDGEKTVEKESTRTPLVEEPSEEVSEENQEETSSEEDNSNSNND